MFKYVLALNFIFFGNTHNLLNYWKAEVGDAANLLI